MPPNFCKFKLPFTCPPSAVRQWRTGGRAIYGLLFTILVAFAIYFGFKQFVISPRRVGITKGIIGQPHLLNPLYAELNPVDAEISKLLFRGFVSYNDEGEIVGDLAESWEVSEDGKVYIFKLKPNLTWHDGECLRADDVTFTYQLTQEEGYQGTEKESFVGVTVQKINEQTVKFILKEPFAPFLDRLTLGILPKHKLFEVSVKDLPKDEFNLNPIGIGLWQFTGLKLNPATKKISNLTMKQFNNETILSFRFYNSEEDLLTAFKLGEINTFTTINPKLVGELKNWLNVKVSNQILNGTSFILFFNLKNKEVLQNYDFRQSLAIAINKEELSGAPVDGPIPPSSWAYFPDITKYAFDKEKAKRLLSQFSEEESASSGLNLKFCEESFCQDLAQKIALFWQEVGVKVNLEKLSKAEVAETIKNRDFEILLLQQNLGFDPDQYALWHSSQIEPPGQNITGFTNRRVDKFLNDARKTLNQDERKNAYREIQKEIAAELPAIFLIQPKEYTVINKKITLGVTPVY